MNEQEIREKAFDGLTSVFENGTEEEMTNYIQEHFFELPTDVQEGIAIALFSEAKDTEAQHTESIADFKEKISAVLERADSQKGV